MIASHLLKGVAQYYDIPTISLRNVEINQALENKDLEAALFTNINGHVDLRHVRTYPVLRA